MLGVLLYCGELGRICAYMHLCGVCVTLTVTVGLGPDVPHAVVEQIEQHQPITVQQNVLAAFVARASLETHSHFISYLTSLQ